MERVLVTGANGFVASHIVQQLLSAKKYLIVGTVRALTKGEHLMKLPGADKRLTLMKADLLKDSGFADAMKNCVAVFHTASPFYIGDHKDRGAYNKDAMCKPAREGTLRILNAASNEKSIRKVIITSSTAAVYMRCGLSDDHVFTEADWSNEAACEKENDWYSISKIQAEKAGLEYVQKKKPHYSVIFINPTLVIGPLLQPELNTSSSIILHHCDGSKKTHPPAPSGKALVDVRDLALAHIKAYECDSKKDKDYARVLMIAACPTWVQICAELREILVKDCKISKSDIDKYVPIVDEASIVDSRAAAAPAMVYSDCSVAEKLLGENMRDWKVSLRDNVLSMKEKGLLTFQTQVAKKQKI